jgi:hypothetical protein
VVGRFRHAALLEDGGVVVADDAEHAVRWYDTRGAHVRSVGREGSGPGEYRAVEWVGVCADSVFAYDRLESRVSVHTRDGRYARQQGAAGTATVFACTADGAVLAVAPTGGNGARGDVITIARDGSSRVVARNVLLAEMRPLGARMRVASDGDYIAFGAGDSAFVSLLQVSTGRLTRVPAGIAGRAPSAGQLDAAIEALATQIRGTQAETDMMRTRLRRMPAARALPAYGELFVDAPSASLWAVRTLPGNSETVIERRRFDGTVTQLVRIPRDLTVFDVRDGRVLALAVDVDSGVEELHVYVPPR